MNSPRNTEHNEKSNRVVKSIDSPWHTSWPSPSSPESRLLFQVGSSSLESRARAHSRFLASHIPLKKLQGFHPSHNRKRSSNHANKVHKDKPNPCVYIMQCWPMFTQSFGFVKLISPWHFCVCFFLTGKIWGMIWLTPGQPSPVGESPQKKGFMKTSSSPFSEWNEMKPQNLKWISILF